MRTPGPAAALASELIKLRTLPAVLLAAGGTVLAGAVLGAALAAARGSGLGAVAAALAAVPFVQAGMLLLGALPFTHEYAGAQIRSTLTAVPRRSRLLLAKTLATLTVAASTAVATMAAALAAAFLTLQRTGGAGRAGTGDASWVGTTGPWPVLGAAGYLVLMALLASAVALMLRQLMPTLVGTLALVLIVSPLFAAQSEQARWLPDRAARQLYAASDTVLGPGTGSLVALAWIVLIGGIAAFRFVHRDA